MDFAAILEKWEKETPGNKFFDKDSFNDSNTASISGKNGERRSRLLKKRPDACIDLHGLTKDDAWNSLELFFKDSYEKGFEKIQIIHGKGNHNASNDERRPVDAVLKDLTRSFIENCPFAGESGYCSARDVGTGATWVIIKRKALK